MVAYVTKPKEIFALIKIAVIDYFDNPDIFSNKKDKELVYCQSIIFYLSRELVPNCTARERGEYFQRSAANAFYSHRKITELLECKDFRTMQVIRDLRHKLNY